LKSSFLFKICIIHLLLFAASCKQAKEKPPVDERKMTQILLDIHLAESYSQGLGDSMKNKFEKNYDTLPSFYTSILKHHSVSFEDFNEAMEWYKQRPVDIDTLYSKVINELNELKAKKGIKDIADAKNSENATPKFDSLKRNRSLADSTKSRDSSTQKSIVKPKPTVKKEP